MGAAPENRFMLIKGLRQNLRIPAPDSPDSDVASASEEAAALLANPEHSPAAIRQQRKSTRSRTTSARGLGYTVSGDAEGPPQLPEELKTLGDNLLEALAADNINATKESFKAFTDQAFHSASTAGAGSRFILHAFANDLITLGKIVTADELIAELRCGGSLVAQTMSLRWDLTGENRNLMRLAQATIDQQAQLQNPVAAEFIIALATALAFQEPETAGLMIESARSHLSVDCEERLLADAIKCLDAGRILKRMSPIAQNVWQQRLRFADRKWNWGTSESRRSLTALASYLQPDSPSAPLFQQIIPENRWAQLFNKTGETSISGEEIVECEEIEVAGIEHSDAVIESDPEPLKIESAAPAKKEAEAPVQEQPAQIPAESPKTPLDEAQAPETTPPATEPKPVPELAILPLVAKPTPPLTNKKALVIASLIVGGTLLVCAGMYWLPAEVQVPQVAQNPVPPSKPAPLPTEPPPEKEKEKTPIIVAKQSEAPPQHVEQSSPPVMAAAPVTLTEPKLEPVPAPKPQPPPAPKPAPKPQVTVASTPPKPFVDLPFDEWKKRRIDDINSQFPSLKVWHELAVSRKWAESARFISGSHPTAPAGSPAHRAFLTWLVLDPPDDPNAARATQNMFIRICPPDDCLDVWEPLVKNKAKNTDDIRSAAGIMMELVADTLSGDEKRRLEKLSQTP